MKKFHRRENPNIDPVLAKLISARVTIMREKPSVGDQLCQYVFDEGSRVATLARDRSKIVFNRQFVADAPDDQLIDFLLGIASRAP